jgi:ubiquinone/menaquinone biosynthesis C-methylase UbiE
MTETERPHSAAYMGPQRDLFWNLDHVELIGRRLELRRVGSVLDVGCGQGHWGRLLATVTAPESTMVGIDREPEWIAEATRQAEAAGLASRFRYEVGAGDELPFPDGSFDLVTCQTLLIQVPDPRAVIAEMGRVARGGGWVLAAEPNNRAGCWWRWRRPTIALRRRRSSGCDSR